MALTARLIQTIAVCESECAELRSLLTWSTLDLVKVTKSIVRWLEYVVDIKVAFSLAGCRVRLSGPVYCKNNRLNDSY